MVFAPFQKPDMVEEKYELAGTKSDHRCRRNAISVLVPGSSSIHIIIES